MASFENLSRSACISNLAALGVAHAFLRHFPEDFQPRGPIPHDRPATVIHCEVASPCVYQVILNFASTPHIPSLIPPPNPLAPLPLRFEICGMQYALLWFGVCALCYGKGKWVMECDGIRVGYVLAISG